MPKITPFLRGSSRIQMQVPHPPKSCFYFSQLLHCLPREPAVCGSFIRVQGVLKDKSCPAVGFNSLLKLSVFPWLTSPYSRLSLCLPPFPATPSPASGFSSSPFSAFGDSQVSSNPWDDLEKNEQGSLSPSGHTTLTQDQKGSSPELLGWKEGAGEKTAPICSNPGSTQALLPCGP